MEAYLAYTSEKKPILKHFNPLCRGKEVLVPLFLLFQKLFLFMQHVMDRCSELNMLEITISNMQVFFIGQKQGITKEFEWFIG